MGADDNDGGDVDKISQRVGIRKAPNCHSMSGASRSTSEAMTVTGMCVAELNSLHVICNNVSIFDFPDQIMKSASEFLLRCITL